MPNVNTRSSERDESLDLGSLIVRTKIDMETILTLLFVVNGQEQDPRKPIRLRLNLKDGRGVVDDNPPESVAPPPTQRGRVTRSDHDLLPHKAHGRTLPEAPGCVPSELSRVGGASLTQSTRASWSVELVAA